MDKYKHAVLGGFITAIVLTFFNRMEFFNFLGQFAIWVGFAFCIGGFIGFEYYQKWFKKGTFDWLDVWAGFLGGSAVFVFALANLFR